MFGRITRYNDHAFIMNNFLLIFLLVVNGTQCIEEAPQPGLESRNLPSLVIIHLVFEECQRGTCHIDPNPQLHIT